MATAVTLKAEKGKKTWIAAVAGRSRKFGLEREFLGPLQAAGQKKTKEYVLDDGLYEVCELDKRSFLRVADGKPAKISKPKLLAALEELDAKRKAEEAKVDQAIARFNQEGGFTLN